MKKRSKKDKKLNNEMATKTKLSTFILNVND